MKYSNFMEVTFKALSVNEGFARVCVASFCVQLNPSVDEITDIKTAVSEAVTNCVVHAYPNATKGDIVLRCELEGDLVTITVQDKGVGIKDVEKAREPFTLLNRQKNVLEWASLLWKVLWTMWKFPAIHLPQLLK